jgi:hypothetical protein
MHGKTIGQCDWSGILFKLPGVSFKFKLKAATGLYCNWESALADVTHFFSSDKELKSYTIRAITKKVGVLPNEAPHFEDLKWFGGYLSESSYREECETEIGELDAVLSVNGVEESVTLDSESGSFFLNWREFEIMYRTPDFEIVALTECPIDAPVKRIILAKRSLLEPWRMNERYIHLPLAEWQHLWKDKSKYMRRELQDELNTYEALVSKDAVLPSSLMKGMKLPGKSGKAIAAYAVLHSL